MSMVGAAAGYSVAKFAIAPTYSAATSMLVNRAADDTSNNNNLTNQQADVQLISTYKNLIISSNVLDTVSKELKNPRPVVIQKAKPAVYKTLADGTKSLITAAQKEVTKPVTKKRYKLSVEQLKSMITITNETNSQVFSINVKSTDSKLSADVANEISHVFKDKIGDFMKVNNVLIIDSAKANNKPVGPNVKLFTLTGLIVLGGLTFLYMLIKELSDTAIKSPDEVAQLFGMTNLGVIGYVKPIQHFNMSSKVEIDQLEQKQKKSHSRLSRME
ncbi:capsular biosynthesis protein [Leuconostoc mesenteroides]|nr:capsular biosynthesis protein [Leuconostoc mesenteroides]MBZ1541536.1 capsular biosynthesis protein [Leuconostoc mesenteroides]